MLKCKQIKNKNLFVCVGGGGGVSVTSSLLYYILWEKKSNHVCEFECSPSAGGAVHGIFIDCSFVDRCKCLFSK